MGISELPLVDRLGDAVYAKLRDAIISGEIEPGARLQVPTLAHALGVSRSPVRDAVIRLTNERLAIDEPRRGAVVVQVDRQQLVALYEVREVLEGLAARMASTSVQLPQLDKDLTLLLTEHEQALENMDVAKHIELDTQFHRLIRRAAGNHELEHMLDHIEAQVRLAMLTVTITSGPHHALDEHRAIYDAIRVGDPEEAQQKACAHIARLRQALTCQADPVDLGASL